MAQRSTSVSIARFVLVCFRGSRREFWVAIERRSQLMRRLAAEHESTRNKIRNSLELPFPRIS